MILKKIKEIVGNHKVSMEIDNKELIFTIWDSEERVVLDMAGYLRYETSEFDELSLTTIHQLYQIMKLIESHKYELMEMIE